MIAISKLFFRFQPFGFGECNSSMMTLWCCSFVGMLPRLTCVCSRGIAAAYESFQSLQRFHEQNIHENSACLKLEVGSSAFPFGQIDLQDIHQLEVNSKIAIQQVHPLIEFTTGVNHFQTSTIDVLNTQLSVSTVLTCRNTGPLYS